MFKTRLLSSLIILTIFVGINKTHAINHKCPYIDCGYTTSYKSHLTRHMGTHTGEKPFKCTEKGCGFESTERSNLTRHMTTHTGEKPYKCTEEGCDYAASRKDHLNSHMRIHNKRSYSGENHPESQLLRKIKGVLIIY